MINKFLDKLFSNVLVDIFIATLVMAILYGSMVYGGEKHSSNKQLDIISKLVHVAVVSSAPRGK